MELHEVVERRVEGDRERLLRLSHELHADPEIGFEEHRSSARVAELLDDAGFDVTHGVAGLDTAVRATAGSGDLVVGICAEYDALPGIGHACGHNVIAAAAVGAALALSEVADDAGLSVRLLGTPAEEGGGGKVLMMERGELDGLHLAMMVHPAPFETATMPCLAVTNLHARFSGRSAHASAFPQLGRNAADALTVTQVAIGLLRQSLHQSDRIHGIVTDGGDAPNVIPERTAGHWNVRAATLAQLAELYPRVRACFEAGALATGTTLHVADPSPPYSEFEHDPELVAAWTANAERLGRTMAPREGLESLAGSTDMANVSLYVPTIHPMLAIDSDGAVNHQPEFAAACATPSADRAAVEGALGMAWTALDVAADEQWSARLRARHFVAEQDYVAPPLLN